jgi:4-hydroxybenzoate polyprenyltransferase
MSAADSPRTANESRIAAPLLVHTTPDVDRLAGPGRLSAARNWVRALRVSHWSKNALIVVPAALAHRVFMPGVLGRVSLAILAFSFVASAVYLVNDLVDLKSDRQHPKKRYRPLAAGQIGTRAALIVAALLAVAAASLSLAFPPAFGAVLLAYGSLTMCYSLYFKRKMFLDIFVLSSLYTARIIAGAAAVQIDLSPWTIEFSIFIFTSLALAKRYAELNTMDALKRGEAVGRAYLVTDRPLIAIMGVASGYIAAMVTALYIYGPQSHHHYTHPEWMWPICPIILYWISRIWLWAQRGYLSEDPVSFAMRDKVSLAALLTLALIATVAA